VAHPQRKFSGDGLDRAKAVNQELPFAVQTATTVEHIPSLPSDVEVQERRPPRYYANRIALAGGASTVALSVVAGTPIAGLAVLGFAIAVKKALWAFGNYVLDNTL
jgi:hypothetical protein